MQERHKQQLSRTWRILASPLFLLLLVVFVVVAGKGAWNMYQKSQEAAAGRVDVEHRLTKLQERESFLRGEVERLGTPAGLELAIREAFNVSREGEKVYVIVDTLSTTTLPDETMAESVVRWFRDLFKKSE